MPTEPATSLQLFGQPLSKAGEIVRAGSARPAQANWTAADTPSTAAPDRDSSSQAVSEQRRRLEAQCQRLRVMHRCPGRCVLSGEPRRGGLATFRRLTEA